MKRLIPALLFAAFAASAFAGMTYKVESVSSGLKEGTLSGVAEVDGKNFRFNIARGDGMIFNDSGFMLSTNGGKTLTVVDPSAKTYYDISIDQMLSGASNMLSGMMHISNPKVTVTDLGAGEKIEGYATQKKNIEISYDLSVDMGGQKMTMNMAMKTQSWVTDQIPAESASFLQTGGLHTGLPDIDKLISEQAKALNGFPLRQITTISMTQGGAAMELKTTTNVTGIEKKSIAASEFVLPAGLTKTDSPVDKMMKGMSDPTKQ